MGKPQDSDHQITGILKQLGDEMAQSLADATSTEEGAILDFDGLMAAKGRDKDALIASIEVQTAQVGDLGVSIAQLKNDLTLTEEALVEDQKFAAELEKGCKAKTAEWEGRVKTRGEELVALASTIKVPNDDDALELFKKNNSSASSSFIQLQTTTAATHQRALAALKYVEGRRLDFIFLALHGQKVGFEKVVKMIDEMVQTLKTEQEDDDHKKEYCHTQLDLADDKKKGLERKVSDEETAISDAKEAIAQAAEEIAALEAGIKALDKAVAEATEQRKAEHADASDLMASNSAAKELLGFAKNRLNKFYNPKLYKAPPKRELSVEDRIAVNMGGEAPPTPAPGGIAGTGITVLAQVSAHAQAMGRDVPPPEPFGAYTKKSEENSVVITMIDLLIKDLDKEMTEAETQEKDAQADYVATMEYSAEKRAADGKSLTEKEGDRQGRHGSRLGGPRGGQGRHWEGAHGDPAVHQFPPLVLQLVASVLRRTQGGPRQRDRRARERQGRPQRRGLRPAPDARAGFPAAHWPVRGPDAAEAQRND